MDSQQVIEAGIRAHEAVSSDTLLWAISSLCGVVGLMALYFVKSTEKDRAERKIRDEQERTDHKEERTILLQIVRDNTQAVTKFEKATEALERSVGSLQRTIDTYIHQER